MEEFVKHLVDPRMQAFAASLEIETEDLQQFFSILSGSGHRTVDLETFVIGCIKLRGMARSVDLIDLVLSHRAGLSEQQKQSKISLQLHKKTETMLQHICGIL